jgi:hypothetical protein
VPLRLKIFINFKLYKAFKGLRGLGIVISGINSRFKSRESMDISLKMNELLHKMFRIIPVEYEEKQTERIQLSCFSLG